MSSDYKKTLKLPQTSFPMKANLKEKEPETLKFWAESDLYRRMVADREGAPRYILHDGPPYANGHLHMGHALNKILKDIIVKSRHMAGLQAPYVPGWDCHGLPIEHKVSQELKAKGKTNLPAVTVRRLCRDYATKFVDIQRKEFKRLGVFGDWDDPYLTMRPSYEAATAMALCDFVERGSVYRGKKPIHWCLSCQTALAEAEVEYADETSPSVFVRFPLPDPKIKDLFPMADPAKTYAVIWTTTPWTLPDNMAVAVHPDFDYVLVAAGDSQYILARELVESVSELFGWTDAAILAEAPGASLEGLAARHPFYDRPSPIVTADYVTLDAGTGLVHTAPGHGREDYDTGLRNGLEVLSPLDDSGRFLDVVPYFAGLTVWEANPKVIEKLTEVGHLLAAKKLKHSYPHCWRCKEPVIFRATTQWFISMDAGELRQKALSAIENDVEWIPAWGKERIHNMIAFRPDWCISRQRTWGVPILALLCESCDTAYNDAAWMRSVAEKFASHERGCDYWFEADLADIVPAGLACPHCGGSHFRKETDILDVWFDSGTSFAAVLEKRPELGFPADMYLEGSDQHRGWFHSSLLAAMGTRGQAPYRQVLTHGYVVDGDGRKMSKSLGNGMEPQEIIDKHGAEILRLWTSAVDYRDDIRISDEILARLVEAYRRIRNTCRFILGNLSDFDPATHDVAPEAMLPLDRFALDSAARGHVRMAEAYGLYEFHKVFHTLHNQCVTDLSAFYLDILKDRLYVSATDSLERRSAQSALWRILLLLLRDMAPILSFTAEEVFRHTPTCQRGEGDSVFTLAPVDVAPWLLDDATRERLELVLALRGEVTRAIEPRRKAGEVGHSLETAVVLYLPDEMLEAVSSLGMDLREVFIVSQATLEAAAAAPADAVACETIAKAFVGVSRAVGEKCARCWVYYEEMAGPESPDLCPRCAAVLAAEGM
ncbi:isoleucine--tRNA ligase [Desulfovibrio sp. TomC]|uniref:isoleucine--tRNA ligase n=1 Tax=Desulfovibrio sp. TomC TaxID=1562888 RepID=UPI000573F208|nr:isoleucine--tRNA ligase [Desulfovibrio sp. TomC]KHK04316.1 Isoleucyl-tRNA synthetase [Desulfovibrio sp. TomC]